MQAHNAQTSPRRVEWVDYARGIGIFSVVALHILNGLISANIIDQAVWVDLGHAWESYSFNMPIFFFLSGLFVAQSVKKPARLFIGSRLRTVVYPYFLWSIVSIVLIGLVGSGSDESITLSLATFARLFYDPVLQYWFLYALFFMLMLSLVIAKLGFSLAWLMPVALLLFVWDFPQEQLIAQRLFLYFAVGVVFSQQIRDLLDRMTSPALLLAAALGLGAWLYALSQGAGFTAAVISPDLMAYLVQAAGFSAVISLCVVLDRWHSLGLFKYWGEKSLEIYLVHVIVGAGVRQALVMLGVEDSLLHFGLGLSLAMVVPLVFAHVMQHRLGIDYLFHWPAQATAPVGPAGEGRKRSLRHAFHPRSR